MTRPPFSGKHKFHGDEHATGPDSPAGAIVAKVVLVVGLLAAAAAFAVWLWT